MFVAPPAKFSVELLLILISHLDRDSRAYHVIKPGIMYDTASLSQSHLTLHSAEITTSVPENRRRGEGNTKFRKENMARPEKRAMAHVVNQFWFHQTHQRAHALWTIQHTFDELQYRPGQRDPTYADTRRKIEE